MTETAGTVGNSQMRYTFTVSNSLLSQLIERWDIKILKKCGEAGSNGKDPENKIVAEMTKQLVLHYTPEKVLEFI